MERSEKVALLISLFLGAVLVILILLAGCSGRWYIRSPFSDDPPVVLHPLTPSHIFFIPRGAVVEWSDMNDVAGDLVYVEQDGYFVSERYMAEVMEASVE